MVNQFCVKGLSKMKARIVYASMTGNDADMADILEEDLQDYGFEVETSEAEFTDASDYLAADLCIFVRSEERRVGKGCSCRWSPNH